MGRQAKARALRRLTKAAVGHLDAAKLVTAHQHLTQHAPERVYRKLVGISDGPERSAAARELSLAVLAEGGFDGVDVRVLDGLVLRVVPDRAAAERAIRAAAAHTHR